MKSEIHGCISPDPLEGRVATLQSRRDRLARCSFWTLRFAVYSSGVNLSRKSSSWRWDGTCAFPSHTATSRSCSPSGVCTPIRQFEYYLTRALEEAYKVG